MIPSIVKRFEKEVSDAIGEAVRTCHSELNSSGEAYEKAEQLLHKQNAELREFLGSAKQTLIEPFDYLADELKKNQISSELALEIFSESLFETEIYQGLDNDKLIPLFGWQSNLKTSALGALAGMRNSLDKGYPSFKDTSVEMLSSGLQKQLATACQSYSDFSKFLKEQEKQKKLDGTLDGVVNNQLTLFINTLNDVVGSALDNQR
ncbi:hypothetical protein CRENPOLYSF2_3770009 [Crenothrix polyspora]|uniref:Uncharacterized protein n=1 Tax=Crenothrix polyspora TaxID=360316 RepID=A0A1R4HD40_9GAMM|nr:hypothetical protein [Crenothrix polyspora]SJM94129.1 hypothetical protein CRENPOLYSF2_3770009 [Crenothrix polyspora]